MHILIIINKNAPIRTCKASSINSIGNVGVSIALVIGVTDFDFDFDSTVFKFMSVFLDTNSIFGSGDDGDVICELGRCILIGSSFPVDLSVVADAVADVDDVDDVDDDVDDVDGIDGWVIIIKTDK
jgi:hypothetical protein